MKVFWSWQSDHPGRISRHFVRESLEQAIKELKQEPDIEEPARDVVLDHDRKGVPGSPDLAAIILEKIKNTSAFVADVTPVGFVEGNLKKKLINSNVAIELGFALGVLTDRAMLMILNEALGSRDDLPFDLKHKAGPITYSLPTNAGKQDIDAERKKLVPILRAALRDILTSISRGELHAFEEEQAAADNPGRFFAKGKTIAHRNGDDLVCSSDHFLYVRVIPSIALPEIKRTEAKKFAQEKLRPLDHRFSGASFEPNTHGILVFERANESNEIDCACQIFRSRELWGFNSYYMSERNGKKGIPSGCHEATLAFGLREYVKFAMQYLGVPLPITVELGVSNVAGHMIYVDTQRFWEKEWGPIHDNHISHRVTINDASDIELDATLLNIFEAIFDAAGTERPERYNDFPGAEPGASPRG